ncbi:MAG: 3-deoxy-D-manno-octulosonic acid transferase, partial [Chryseobacterium sp.]
TIVFGSSWSSEEKIAEIIFKANSDSKMIIAPHDLKRVQNLKQIFPDALLYSEIHNQSSLSDHRLLIIDSIGLLSKLYSYSDIAVVGGGFHDAGLHNILEAATFGMPVIFGNHYRKNPEADDLIKANGGKSFEEENVAADFALFLMNDNDEVLNEMSANSKKFVDEKPNSTEIILKKILS